MLLRDLLKGTGIPCPPGELEIAGVSFDTRHLRPGELFVALPGYRTDGGFYIAQAAAKGAAAIVAQAGGAWEGERCAGVPVLLAADSRAALARLSANWFRCPGEELTLIGVTGTNGKTTVTTLLSAVLREVTGAKTGLIGTNEIVIGEEHRPAQRTTPESRELQEWLRRMVDAGCPYAVMEVSSHALGLKRVEGLQFDVGAFTNLTQDHLDFHGTMEAYRETKGRLFLQSAAAVLNWDDDAGREYANACTGSVFRYSASGRQADWTAEDIRLLPDATVFLAKTADRQFSVRVPIPGRFTVSNALCVLGCCEALRLPLDSCVSALARVSAVRGRMEHVPIPGPGSVVIDYAHTPDALEQTLLSLREFTRGRLICLFGCGGDRDRGKRPLMGEIAARLSDVCIVTSDNPRSEPPSEIVDGILAGMTGTETALVVELDREVAIGRALGMLGEGDVLLLAGKGHETYQEVNGERRHMDEREIVKRWFAGASLS